MAAVSTRSEMPFFHFFGSTDLSCGSKSNAWLKALRLCDINGLTASDISGGRFGFMLFEFWNKVSPTQSTLSGGVGRGARND